MKSINTVIFEDYKYKNFFPLTLTRPVFMLKNGFFSVYERIILKMGIRHISFLARDYLNEYTEINTGFSPLCLKEYKEDNEILFINGRVIDFYPEEIVEEDIAGVDENENIVFVKAKTEKLIKLIKDGLFFDTRYEAEILNAGFRTIKSKSRVANYIWDLINYNGEAIERDFYFKMNGHGNDKIDMKGVYFINKEKVYIDANVKIYPDVVIDGSEGPVYICSNVKIMPGTFISGPCYIGESSLLKPGTYISGGTTIGEVCKIGGEIEETIIHSFSNKQHYGFLGNSYIGQWCNLGAGSCTSNLKNNYGNVKITLDGKNKIETGQLFLGTIMGDHTKIGIGMLLNTGTSIGVMCNIFGGGIVSGYIPSFSWGGQKGFEKYRFDKAVETADRVMARRNKRLTEVEMKVLDYVYNFK